jgi:hypothetical protein
MIDNWKMLEARLFWLRLRIDECVKRYGEKNVLFEQKIDDRFAAGSGAEQ